MTELKLETPYGEVTLIDEAAYTLGSADNVRRYPKEIVAGKVGWSFHGIKLGDELRAVVTGDGAPTEVHAHSAVVWHDQLVVAVGNHCVCLSLPDLGELWSREVDMATCFGVHLSPDGEALISHGELSISRLSREGQVLWDRGGRDIFTGDFGLAPDHISVEDFNGDRYQFSYDGKLIEGPSST